MANEVEQPAAEGRTSAASVQSPSEKKWTDIGEARIVETMFGKAKIRITHKHDGARRAGLLGLTLLGLATAVLIGQMALKPQSSDVSQSAIPVPTLNDAPTVSAPPIQSVAVASSITPAIVMNKPVSSRKKASQPVAETMPAAPVAPLLQERATPVMEEQQHAAPAAGNEPAK